MLRTSAYRLKIRTDSADDNALILLANGELVAILMELADEAHGEDAANWVSDYICHDRFDLAVPINELP